MTVDELAIIVARGFAKVDTVRLQQWAAEEVQKLRARGRWDG